MNNLYIFLSQGEYWAGAIGVVAASPMLALLTVYTTDKKDANGDVFQSIEEYEAYRNHSKYGRQYWPCAWVLHSEIRLCDSLPSGVLFRRAHSG